MPHDDRKQLSKYAAKAGKKSQAEVRELPPHHMEPNLKIRKIKPEETDGVTNLALSVFMEFEAPDYSAEGVRAFKAFLSDREMLSLFTIYGAFENGTPIGMLAVRDGVHISLFFVDGRHHRKGVGTALFRHFLSEVRPSAVTVNAAPFALPFYRHLGFVQTGLEALENGIRYTPMLYRN